MTINNSYKAGCIKSIINFCEAKGCFLNYGLKNVSTYQWPKKGPSVDALLKNYDEKYQLKGQSNYEKNVELKLLLSEEFKSKNLDVRKISEWIIKSWGGIPKLSKNIDEYIKKVSEKEYPNMLSGVASYSKLFAMFYPREFAIYDARVAVSLNVIQLLSDECEVLFFPYLSGRNKITGYQKTKKGFSRLPEFNRANISKTSGKSWGYLDAAEVYPEYNNILTSICFQKNWNLWDIEMLLFSKAEDLVMQIRKDKNYSSVNWSPICP